MFELKQLEALNFFVSTLLYSADEKKFKLGVGTLNLFLMIAFNIVMCTVLILPR